MSKASPADFVRRMREARMFWIEVEPAQPGVSDVPGSGTQAKRLRLIRPSEQEMGETIIRAGHVHIGAAEVARFVVDWSGYTEADVLGSTIGSSDPLPFSPDIWAEYVGDRSELGVKVQTALLDALLAFFNARKEDRKN